MVGHTGDLEAAKKACETVDGSLREVVESGLGQNYEMMIIADHGNAIFLSHFRKGRTHII